MNQTIEAPGELGVQKEPLQKQVAWAMLPATAVRRECQSSQCRDGSTWSLLGFSNAGTVA